MTSKKLNNIDIALFALCLLAGLLLAAPASIFAQSPAQSPATQFTDELWSEIQTVYDKTLEHPFLTGMADGTLPQENFQYYLIQDAHYLRRFSQALSVLAAKAPRQEWSVTLNEHAAGTLKSEQQLHLSIGKTFGVSPEEFTSATVAPLNLAYTNHLLATAYSRPFAGRSRRAAALLLDLLGGRETYEAEGLRSPLLPALDRSVRGRRVRQRGSGCPGYDE